MDDPPGSDLTVSQLLFALKWKLERLRSTEALDTKLISHFFLDPALL